MLLPPEVAAAGEERERGDEGEGHHYSLVRIFPEACKRLARVSQVLSNVQYGRVGVAEDMMLKTMPVARRVLGENARITLKMQWVYAAALFNDTDATLDDLREAVTTLEETERTTRRVLGGAHPLTTVMEEDLRDARAALAAREGDDVSALCDGVDAMTPGGA